MIQVNKRNGRNETLDIEKLHKVVFYACENITGVSPSEVELKSQIQFYNGVTSKEIQETLIKQQLILSLKKHLTINMLAADSLTMHYEKKCTTDLNHGMLKN